MAFPPNFDAVWDETSPPDTQAANLLGLDIRNTKRDIRERLALLSGTLANRPTPDANWGGVGYGVLYFSTDTAQVFQWSGAAWVDVTSFIAGNRLSNSVQVITNAANQDGISVVIPAGALQIGSVVRVVAELDLNTNDSVALFFGATNVAFAGLTNPNVIRAMFSLDLVVSGAASQIGFFSANTLFTTGGGPIVVNNSFSQNVAIPAEAIANAITVKTRQLVSGAGLNVSHNMIAVTWR